MDRVKCQPFCPCPPPLTLRKPHRTGNISRGRVMPAMGPTPVSTTDVKVPLPTQVLGLVQAPNGATPIHIPGPPVRLIWDRFPHFSVAWLSRSGWISPSPPMGSRAAATLCVEKAPPRINLRMVNGRNLYRVLRYPVLPRSAQWLQIRSCHDCYMMPRGRTIGWAA